MVQAVTLRYRKKSVASIFYAVMPMSSSAAAAAAGAGLLPLLPAAGAGGAPPPAMPRGDEPSQSPHVAPRPPFRGFASSSDR